MVIEDIKKKIETDEYSFLNTDKHLGNNIILLGIGGSHSYGTSTPESDIDLRGVAVRTKQDILLNRDFESVRNGSVDTTIYSFDKYIKLLCSMNPSICETLGLKEEHYLHVSPIGKELLDNKNLFISKKCISTFKGYVDNKLHGLKAFASGKFDQQENELYILKKLNHMMASFNNYTNFSDDSIGLYIDKSMKDDIDTEIFIDMRLKKYPLRDVEGMLSEMYNVVKAHSKLGKRNKYAIEKGKISKHMYSLTRLPYMCLDILNGKGIITYRENEHDLLMSIRNGEWLDVNGMPSEKFFALIDILMDTINTAAKYSKIPDNPNYEEIEKFVLSVNERIVRGDV